VGATHTRIILMHIIPNIFPTILVLFSIGIGANIVAEASLSFLGYGVPPPSPTWGGMMSAEGRVYMIVDPWILVAPTVALAIVVYAMNMFGDALRDELDPRLRGSR
jgi:peptide/nickel transport system permease protein